jgi:hypothetical protein
MSFITIPVRIEGAFYKNTAAGYLSLVKNTPGSFPNGEDNTALGYLSLSQNTTGEGNSALGSNSLALNVSGRFNVAIGERASYNNTTGQFNVSVGSTALTSSTNSDYNTAIGYGACGVLAGNVGSNTMIGAGAGAVMTTGAKNTILGRYNGNQGGLDIRTASNYCVISDGDGNPRIIVDPAGLVSAPGGFSGGGGGGAITIDNKTAAYTVVSGDLGKIINCTANTFTVNLTAAATLGAGFNVWVWNSSTVTSSVITILPSGIEQIDGATSITLRRGEGLQLVCTGTGWLTGDKKRMRAYAENMTSSANSTAASGDRSLAIGWDCTASGTGSTSIGNNSSAAGARANSSGSIGLAGTVASGTDSFASSASSNSSTWGTNGNSAISIGTFARAQANDAVALGTNSTSGGSSAVSLSGGIANGARSFAWGTPFSGAAGTASGSESVAFGELCQALQQRSFAYGHGSRSNTYGKFAYACGFFAASGDNQYGRTTLRSDTTTATPEVMTTNNGFGSSTNQLNLSDNFSAIAFEGLVVARRQGTSGTETAAWKIEGLARRESGIGTTTLITSTVTVISNVPGWGLALSADTVNGAVAITVTGAALNIRWSATVHTSEVTYA